MAEELGRISLTADADGTVVAPVRWILQGEGAAVLALATLGYAHAGASWWLYAILFFAPDISFLGYLRGPSVGAAFYNALHSYIVPIPLGLLAGWAGEPTLLAVALVWCAHIGFDRMVGYGLKYGSAFGHTHLGRVGRN